MTLVETDDRYPVVFRVFVCPLCKRRAVTTNSPWFAPQCPCRRGGK